jgi:uncharacterized protein (TIGR02147 family)
MLEVYETDNYKEALKSRLKALKQSRPGLTLKVLAQGIGVQYTYLSKTFNQEDIHLSEDHLFRFCQMLDLDKNEMEFILLQRSHALTGNDFRREYLYKKIEQLRQEKKLNGEVLEHKPDLIEKEMNYLFDPYCVLVHASLFINKYRENSAILSDQLNITLNHLREILLTLNSNGFITLGEGPFDIKEVRAKSLHYGRSHPLMRVHQTLFKTAMANKLSTTAEEDKICQMFSFTMDENGFKEVSDEYQTFIKKVQKIAQKSRKTELFQINFDFFKWH